MNDPIDNTAFTAQELFSIFESYVDSVDRLLYSASHIVQAAEGSVSPDVIEQLTSQLTALEQSKSDIVSYLRELSQQQQSQ